MRDLFNREIKYLRLSITDLCNLRCAYCMPIEGVEKLEHSQILSIEQMLNIAKAAKRIGIEKIRLTGGEPLVKKSLLSLISGISELNFKTLAMTTNGIGLEKIAKTLKQLKVQFTNISLDTLNENTFEKITTKRNLKNVLLGIDAALDAGLTVKLNTVLLKDINDSEVDDLIEYAREKKVLIRFIELMPSNFCKEYYQKHFLSNKEIINSLDLQHTGTSGVSELFKLPNGQEIGFISPISDNFCHRCDKIRITSDGTLYPCLHLGKGYSIKSNVDDVDKLSATISNLITKKPCCHKISQDITNLNHMSDIGG